MIKYKLQIEKVRPCITRAGWAQQNYIIVKREETFMTTWCLSFLPMNIRDFAVRFLNNKIYLNANLENAYGHIPDCTFCSIHLVQDPPRENNVHFWRDCTYTSRILQQYFDVFFQNTNINWDKNMVFLGAPPNLNNEKATVVNIEIILALHFLYNCKQKKKHPFYIILTFIWAVIRAFLWKKLGIKKCGIYG